MSPSSTVDFSERVALEQAAFLRKVYLLMTAGLAVTGIVALLVASSEAASRLFVLNPVGFYGAIVVEIVLVVTFSAVLRRTTALVAGALFFTYAAVSGLSFSVIFLAYTKSSIAATFFVTAGMFGAMSAYGYLTKRDLNGLGSFAMMGLVGTIAAAIVNIWEQSSFVSWATTLGSILVFVALTAYDTQKILRLNVIGNAGTDEDQKEAIHGALVLYLDFINLFVELLRLMGRRRGD